MNILLDTCTFLWIVSGSTDLSDTARRLFSDPDNEVYLSVASAWEIIVKHKLGKLPLPGPLLPQAGLAAAAEEEQIQAPLWSKEWGPLW